MRAGRAGCARCAVWEGEGRGRRRRVEGEGRGGEAGAKAGVSAHHAPGISYLKFSHRKEAPRAAEHDATGRASDEPPASFAPPPRGPREVGRTE